MWHTDRLHGNLLEPVPKLGPGITPSPPPPPGQTLGAYPEPAIEDRNLNAKYALSGQQRQLAYTGDANDRSKTNKRVLEKRDRLPERIQDLLTDILLLHAGGYTHASGWETGRVEPQGETADVGQITRRAVNYDEDFEEAKAALEQAENSQSEYYQSPYDTLEDLWTATTESPRTAEQVHDEIFVHSTVDLSKESQLGYQLGSALRTLKPVDGSDVPGSDLIWGFILAFIGDSHTDVADTEAQKLNNLIDELRARHEERQTEASRMEPPDEVSHKGRGYHELTAEGVKDADINPRPIICREVSYHQQTTPDDGSLHKDNARHITIKIADATPLREVDDLYSDLTEDITTVQNEGHSGLEPAQTPLHEIWTITSTSPDETDGDDNEANERLTSETIANRIGKAQNQVTAVFNRVASTDRELWTNHPLLEKRDSSAERGTTWELTAYGNLVSYAIFERDADADWTYRYAIGPEELSLRERKLVTDVLAEFGHIES